MSVHSNENTLNNTSVKNKSTANIDLDRTPNNNSIPPSLNTSIITTLTIKDEQDLVANNIDGYPELNQNSNNNDIKQIELNNNSQEQKQQNKNNLVDNINMIDKKKQDLEDVSNMYNKMLIGNTNLNKEIIQLNNNNNDNNNITNNECSTILN